MVAEAQPPIAMTVSQQYVIVKNYIKLESLVKHYADGYIARLRALLSHDEYEYAMVRDWALKPQAPITPIDDTYEVRILACPFTAHNSRGEFFTAATNFHVSHMRQPMLLYRHNREGSEEARPGGPDIIGRIVQRYVDAVGVWYVARLDRRHELAQRVWQAVKRGTARASVGTMLELLRIEPSGEASHWLVLEVSLFDVPDRASRQQAQPWSVVIPATLKLPPMVGDVPAAFAWSVERKIDTDPQLQHLRAQLDQFVTRD